MNQQEIEKHSSETYNSSDILYKVKDGYLEYDPNVIITTTRKEFLEKIRELYISFVKRNDLMFLVTKELFTQYTMVFFDAISIYLITKPDPWVVDYIKRYNENKKV